MLESLKLAFSTRLNVLKLALVKQLGLATKDELEAAFKNVLLHTESLIELQVPELVKEELDKDERTVIFNPVISLHVDEQGIKDAVNQKLNEALSSRYCE